MNVLLLPFLLLSALGFVLSVAAHIMGLLGIVPPGGSLVMGLHTGIFVVWIPTVLIMMRTRSVPRRDIWNVALSGCPIWMRKTWYALFVYAFVNFFLCMFSMYALHGHRYSSQAVSPEIVRMFSGHWMFFYATAFAVLYSSIMSAHILRERRCANGHLVSSVDAYCSTCGCPLNAASPPKQLT